MASGFQNYDSTNSLFSNIENQKASYVAASNISIATNATDFFTLSGSSTKTVRITRVTLQFFNATTSTQENVLLIHRITANSGGATSTLNNANKDFNDANSTAVATQYSSNPTSLGTGATVGSFLTQFSSTAPYNILTLTYGSTDGKGIVLRGTSQFLAINMNGSNPASSTVNVIIEWTEE